MIDYKPELGKYKIKSLEKDKQKTQKPDRDRQILRGITYTWDLRGEGSQETEQRGGYRGQRGRGKRGEAGKRVQTFRYKINKV